MASNSPSGGAAGETTLVAAGNSVDPERERQEAEWRAELARLEYEITTLRSVLNAKTNEATLLKRKLGITPLVELKQDLKLSVDAVKESDAYQKTNTAIRSFGDYASRKLGDIRNSNAFKSVEVKVGDAVSSVKRRVSSSKSEGNFEDALQESAMASPSGAEPAGKLPEEKVPL